MRFIAEAVGIQDSAIYRHFPSKQAIFDALMEEVGPTVALHVLQSELDLGGGPRRVILALVERLTEVWDEPRARQFVSVGMREGGPGSQLAEKVKSADVQRTIELLGTLFQDWRDAGHLRDDVPVEQLAWELMAPLAYIRMTHLLADSSEDARSTGRRLIARHVDFFLTCMAPREVQGDPANLERARPHE
jgi:AcrR family transcriptional regulator